MSVKVGVTAAEVATALRAGQLKELKKLAISCDDINEALDENGTRLLHLSAEKVNVKFSKIILAASADPNVLNKSGRSPLHIAARNGYLPVVDLLLQNGAHGSAADLSGITPLHSLSSTALRSNEEKLFKKIVTKLRDQDKMILQATTKNGDTCLHFVCYGADDPVIAKLLVNTFQIDVNVCNEGGQTPLELAAAKGAERVCAILLNAGAHITPQVLKLSQKFPQLQTLFNHKKYAQLRELGHEKQKKSQRAQKDINSALKDWIGDSSPKRERTRTKVGRDRRKSLSGESIRPYINRALSMDPNDASPGGSGFRRRARVRSTTGADCTRNMLESTSIDALEDPDVAMESSSEPGLSEEMKNREKILLDLIYPVVPIINLSTVLVPSSLENAATFKILRKNSKVLELARSKSYDTQFQSKMAHSSPDEVELRKSQVESVIKSSSPLSSSESSTNKSYGSRSISSSLSTSTLSLTESAKEMDALEASRPASSREAVLRESQRRVAKQEQSLVTSLATAEHVAVKKKVKTISLNNQGIFSLPPFMFEYRRLRALHLDHNNLTELPEEVSLLERLEALSVSHNKISQLSPQFSKLKRLAVLDVSYNCLTSSHVNTVFECENLEEFTISHNKLTQVPAHIHHPHFTKLILLDISHNEIEEIPSEIGTLIEHSFQELRAEGNPLSKMPEEVQTGESDKLLTYLASNVSFRIQLPNMQSSTSDDKILSPRAKLRQVRGTSSTERISQVDLLSYVPSTPNEAEEEKKNDIPQAAETNSSPKDDNNTLQVQDGMIGKSASASDNLSVPEVSDDLIKSSSESQIKGPPKILDEKSSLLKEWSIMINQKCIGSYFSKRNLTLLDNSSYPDYEHYFFPNAHVNLVGITKKGEPVVVSILKEPLHGNYRALIRSQTRDARAFIPEELVSKVSTGVRSTARYARTRSLLKGLLFVHPIDAELREVSFASLSNEYLDLEARTTTSCYKFGLLHCPDGASSEEQIFSSQGSDNFWEFCDLIGKKVPLKDWDRYSGGLDTKSGTTGEFSYYSSFKDLEIMFHVSCLLPYQEDDEQKLERKRHIGNDIVCIVFLEGDTPFDPTCIATHFIHVYIVVKKLERKTLGKLPVYQIQVIHKDTLRPVLPWIPPSGVLEGNADFVRFLMTKMVNAERAAMMAPSFSKLLRRTRGILLQQFLDRLQKHQGGVNRKGGGILRSLRLAK